MNCLVCSLICLAVIAVVIGVFAVLAALFPWPMKLLMRIFPETFRDRAPEFAKKLDEEGKL